MPTKANYIAGSNVCKEALRLSGLSNEIRTSMGLSQQKPITLYIANGSVIKLVKN